MISAIAGLSWSHMRPARCALDSDAVPSLLRKDIVEHDWMSAVRIREKPRLQIVRNRRVEAVGTIMLHICMGIFCVSIASGIVKNLAIPALFVTSFIDGLQT